MVASLVMSIANQLVGASKNVNQLDAGYGIPRKQGKLNNQQDDEAIIYAESIVFSWEITGQFVLLK